MRWLLLALSLLGVFLPTHQAQAQSSGVVVQVCGTLPLAYRPGAQGVISLDVNGNTCIAGTFSATGGTISNATDNQAPTGTNQGAVAYNYGFNGVGWDRLQVDASKFLKVNCAAGCTAGTASNATSGQATSATNGQSIAWLYGFNGATWDQLSSLTVGSKHALTTAIVDGAGNQITSFGVSGTVSNATSAVATSATNIGAVSWLYGFNGATWDQLQVDGSKSLKINCITGCGGAGTISNATSGVATSATNTGTVAYNYGFNGTTWDQLQVDASKFLKVTLPASSIVASAAVDGWDVTQGAKADAACGTDNGTCSEIALIKRTNQNLTTVNTSINSAIPAGTAIIGFTSLDPCNGPTAKLNKAFSQTAGAVLIAGVSAKKTYVCSMSIVAGAAEIFNLIEGTGSVCATGGAAVMGSTTAANGLSVAANGGLTLGGGVSAVAFTATNADDLCLTQSTSSRLAGNVTYVQQ